MDSESPIVFKILLLGVSGVGKSEILQLFTEKTLLKNRIGIDSKSKIIKIDNQEINLKIWDIQGQERFRNITSQFYKDADGLVLIYDVTDKFSFERLNKWIEQIISSIGSNEISMVLLGNKCEMEVRTVTKEMGNQLAEKYKINYFETSYKTGQGINLSKLSKYITLI